MESKTIEKKLGTFILEIGVEEMPAGQIESIANHIKLELEKLFQSHELNFSESKTFFSPRRLFYEIKELELFGLDKEIEIKGPPAQIALKDGKLSEAGLGFIKKNNLNENQVSERDGYLYGSYLSKGTDAKSLIETNFQKIISKTPGERFMRWSDGETKFTRPIEWIASQIIFQGESQELDLTLEEIKSSSNSYGHRFLGDSLKLSESKDFLFKLKEQGVILDNEERKSFILNESKKLASSINAEVLIDENLLIEVSNLVENPCPILCSFDKNFLKIPKSVLITVMAKHQRYFPLLNMQGELLPNFITISNNPLEKARENIRKGNEKVIVPRFKDAEFFVEEDLQISLEDRLLRLEKINFSIGNMLQKSYRIEKITRFLIEELKDTLSGNPAIDKAQELSSSYIEMVLRAAKLCKADLSTHLVFEFTELQGEIGGVYASMQGEDELIAKSIEEHYMPRFAGDKLGNTLGARLISIADRVDNLVCAFALGKIPKGSADPFALRRQANGLLELILHSHLIFNINKLIDYSVELALNEFGTGKFRTIKRRGEEIEIPEYDWDSTPKLLKEFLESRLEFVFQINHKGIEINKMVLEAAELDALEDLNKKHMLVHYFYELKTNPNYEKLLEALKRISNILKNEKDISCFEPDEKLFENNFEKNLYISFKNLEPKILSPWRYSPKLMQEDLVILVDPIAAFFDNVLVNDGNEDLRANRIRLLNFCKKLTDKLISF